MFYCIQVVRLSVFSLSWYSYRVVVAGHVFLLSIILYTNVSRPPSSGSMGTTSSVHATPLGGPLASTRGRQRNSVAVVDSRDHIYEELEISRAPPKLTPVSGVLQQVRP